MRLIDADELQKAFTEECCGCCDCCSHCMTGYKCELIDNAPTISIDRGIDAGDMTVYARWTGEWITIKPSYPFPFECSNCGHQNLHKPRYCSCCGAKMKGAEE